jgi:hypothetical protein
VNDAGIATHAVVIPAQHAELQERVNRLSRFQD